MRRVIRWIIRVRQIIRLNLKMKQFNFGWAIRLILYICLSVNFDRFWTETDNPSLVWKWPFTYQFARLITVFVYKGVAKVVRSERRSSPITSTNLWQYFPCMTVYPFKKVKEECTFGLYKSTFRWKTKLNWLSENVSNSEMSQERNLRSYFHS